MERTSIRSFLGNGHSFHLYKYGKVEGIPKGVEVKDAKSIMDEGDMRKYKGKKDYATFSDIFRYKLLLEKGGIWVDTDIICLRPFDFNGEHVFASERVERQSKWEVRLPSRPVGCVIKSPKGSEMMSYCLEKSKEKSFDKIKWAEVGPDLLTKAVKKFEMQESVFPPWKFCPIPWWKWENLSETSVRIRIIEGIKRSVLKPYSYHLWHSKWGSDGKGKNDIYPQNTIYGSLQNEFLEDLKRQKI